MNLKDHILLWNHASVEVIDIRRSSFEAEEKAPLYRLSTSAFLYAIRGTARVLLDDTLYEFNRSHVIHGGKGTTVQLFPGEETLEYYLILYRAMLSLPARSEEWPFNRDRFRSGVL